MSRKVLLDTAVPRLKLYLPEHSGPLTAEEVAELLGVSRSAAYSVLLYMEAMDIIHHVRRGRKNLYFLKGANDESRLASMLEEARAKAPHRPKRRKRDTRVERTTNSILEEEPMVVPYPSAHRDMLPALAILGMYQTESSKPKTQPQESKRIKTVEKRVGTPLFITVERHGRVKFLPKEARLLSRGDTTYLKERYLRGLDGYEDIERFDCFFSEASALERGVYGNVFYASMGTNPWEKVYKVTVERSRDKQHG